MKGSTTLERRRDTLAPTSTVNAEGIPLPMPTSESHQIAPTTSSAPGNWSYVQARQWNAAQILVALFGGILGHKEGGRGIPPPATEKPARPTALPPSANVANPRGQEKHPRRRRPARTGPSSRYVSLVTDGAELLGPVGRRMACDVADAAELADVARRLVTGDAELIVFVHPAAHERWALPPHQTGTPPAFFAGAKQLGTGFVVAGTPSVHVMLPAHTGDFADARTPDELLAAVEAFRDAVGMSYLFSGASTLHRLIRVTSQATAPPAEPELDPPYSATAYATPAAAWSRPLTPPERRRGWVAALDRSGSYLAAWRGLYLSDGPWQELGPAEIGPGPEGGRPPGYWLLGETSRRAVEAAAARHGLPDPLARHGAPDGPLWATTPLLHLAVEILADGAQRRAVGIERAWITPDRCRPLEKASTTLAGARETLAASDAGRVALDVVKTAYAAAVAWMEYGPGAPDPLHRPHWRRTILDRHVANTYRALARSEPPPFALTAVDCALFALDGPGAAPAGLRLGTALGAWKPKGTALPMEDARRALEDGGVRAVMTMIEGGRGGDPL